MSFKNKYNEYQRYQLSYQGAVNLYHRLAVNSKSKYPISNINIGTGAKLVLIPCTELAKKKPKSIPKMRARFQRANQIRYHKEVLATIKFMWGIEEDGLQATIQDTDPKDIDKLPFKIKAQVKYLKQELGALVNMLDKAIPEFYNYDSYDLIKAEQKAIDELKKTRP